MTIISTPILKQLSQAFSETGIRREWHCVTRPHAHSNCLRQVPVSRQTPLKLLRRSNRKQRCSYTRQTHYDVTPARTVLLIAITDVGLPDNQQGYGHDAVSRGIWKQRSKTKYSRPSKWATGASTRGSRDKLPLLCAGGTPKGNIPAFTFQYLYQNWMDGAWC